MPVDEEIMADVRHVNGKSRWGGQLKPRKMGVEHVTTVLNQHSLRKLDGHGSSMNVSLLGIASKTRDLEQLRLESLFAEFQQLKIEKERLEREDELPSIDKCPVAAKHTASSDFPVPTNDTKHSNSTEKKAGANSYATWAMQQVDEVSVLPTRAPSNGTCTPEQIVTTTEDAQMPQASVAGHFSGVLRQHAMTPVPSRTALPVDVNPRSESVDFSVGGASRRDKVSPQPPTRLNGRDSVDLWLLNELAWANDSETKTQPGPEPEPEPSTVHRQLGPLTQWLQSLGLEQYAPQVLSMLPEQVLYGIDDKADCQFYFEDLVRTRRGLAEVRSLCKACRMASAEESHLLQAVRASATAKHTPNAPKCNRAGAVQNMLRCEPGTAAREAVNRRSVAAETKGSAMRSSGSVSRALARSNRAADLRASKSHAAAPSVDNGRRGGKVAKTHATAGDEIENVRRRAPFSSLLLEEHGAAGGPLQPRETVRRSGLASGVLTTGRQLLRQREKRLLRSVERAAAEEEMQKQLSDFHLSLLQMNI